jgi:hypothetical protein
MKHTKRQLRLLYPQAWTPEQRELQAYVDATTRPYDDADLLLTLRAASAHPDLSPEARALARRRMPSVEGRLADHAQRGGGTASHWLAPGFALVVTTAKVGSAA